MNDKKTSAPRRKRAPASQFGKTLIDSVRLANRVRELGQEISRDYAGKNLVVIGVLKGAALFTCDLVRHITVPVTLDFIQARSYEGRTSTSGEVRIFSDPSAQVPIEGQDVLVVEDIVDSGVTAQYLRKLFLTRNPASFTICSLLDKPSRRRIEVPVKYVGFTIPNVFVVGYGLDYKEMYRNMPYIATIGVPNEG